MNFEEKYNGALERARKFSEKPLQEDSADIVEYIFPELKESKDEIVRKWIISYFEKSLKKDCPTKLAADINDALEWLEKQSEKKSADEVLKIRQELYQSGYNDGYKHGQEDIDDAYLQGICDAKNELEKQGEQKTDPCTDCANDKGCVTCEHGELREAPTRTLNADKVIEWLNHHELIRDDVVTSVIPDDSPTSVPHRVKWLSDEFIKKFKKDFGL